MGILRRSAQQERQSGFQLLRKSRSISPTPILRSIFAPVRFSQHPKARSGDSGSLTGTISLPGWVLLGMSPETEKRALRGGYGIGYERNFGNVTFNVIQNPPNYAVLDLPGRDRSEQLRTICNAGGTLPLAAVSLRIVNPNIKNAYAHMWNFSLERQITSKIIWSAEYSGSKGVDLYTISYPNEKGYGNLILGDPCTPPNCTSAPRNTQYGQGIGYRGNQGFSNYNALNTEVVVRNVGNAGIDMTMNYTWSHAIDNVSSTFFEAAGVQTQYGNSNITTNNGNFVYGLFNPYNPTVGQRRTPSSTSGTEWWWRVAGRFRPGIVPA